jgi:hypothetical protein
VGFDSHRYLTARPGAGGFEPQYYESYREPWGMPWRLPSLSSDVATGPYLRLFVPFSPERTEDAVRARCPDLAPRFEPGLRVERRYGDPGAEPAAAAALRDCLLRHVRVELDGRPLPAERFVLGVHPVSGGRGLLAQLPVADLASGEHRVTVVESRRAGDRRPPRRHVIPFWR